MVTVVDVLVVMLILVLFLVVVVVVIEFNVVKLFGSEKVIEFLGAFIIPVVFVDVLVVGVFDLVVNLVVVDEDIVFEEVLASVMLNIFFTNTVA